MTKTSLSAGIILRDILLANAGVSALTEKIFPVVTDSALLPYIVYRRSHLEPAPTKSGQPGADQVQIDLTCYAATYEESVELAEAVRAALDYTRAEYDGLTMRCCLLAESEELYEGDAFGQLLTFNVKI